MTILEAIQAKIWTDQFEFSRHAVDQMLKKTISVAEVRQTILSGEVIEDYPNDKYGPSCLVLGFTAVNRPIHVQCTHASRLLVKIITAYEPDPARWIDFKERRQ